jgi:hypothetical protein
MKTMANSTSSNTRAIRTSLLTRAASSGLGPSASICAPARPISRRTYPKAISETAAQPTIPKTTNGSLQSQLPSSTSSEPLTNTRRDEGRKTYIAMKERFRPNAAEALGSPERFASTPKAWPASAPPSHAIVAVMCTNSQSSYEVIRS